jgi:hypothetical protein
MAVGSRGIARPRCTPPSLRRSSGRGRSPTFPSHVLVEQRPHSPSRQTAADHRRSRRRCRRASGRASSPTACRRRGPLPPARRKRDTLTVPLKPRFLQVLDDLRSPCRQAGPARRGPAQVTVRQAQPPVSPAVGPGPVPEFVTASVRAPVGAAVVRGGLSTWPAVPTAPDGRGTHSAGFAGAIPHPTRSATPRRRASSCQNSKLAMRVAGLSHAAARPARRRMPRRSGTRDRVPPVGRAPLVSSPGCDCSAAERAMRAAARTGS